MDPLTIVSLVGTIVQFVDFGGRIISKTYELYNSAEGASEENSDALITTSHLSSYLDQLATPIGPQVNALSNHEQKVEDLRRRCHLLAQELSTKIESLTVVGTGGKRFFKSIAAVGKGLWGSRSSKL